MKNKQKTVTIEASKVLFRCTHSLSEGVLNVAVKLISLNIDSRS